MSTKAQPGPSVPGVGQRLEFIDVARGLAVVFMIWMHTADGWLMTSLRSGPLWDLVRTIGGLAAPMFLLLAGVSLGLVWARAPDGERAQGLVARGLSIVVLGYGLRLQMWVVDGGGYKHTAALPLALGYLTLLYGLWPGRPRPARPAAVALGLSLVGLGLYMVSISIPAKLEGLLRVDVLQAIGAGLVVVSALGATARQGRLSGTVAVLAGLGVAVGTPLMRAWVPGPLPDPVAAYIAWWHPGAGRTAASFFPLFPWMAYVFVGSALGQRWGRLGSGPATRDSALAWCALGALIATTTFETLPHMRALLDQWPAMTQAVRVCYRVGACLVFIGLAVGLSHSRLPRNNPLTVLGRASLLVYWVHLEFAFGLAARPLKKSADVWQWVGGLITLIAAMTLIAWLRSRLGSRRRN